jgi:hypothetical protein
MVGTARKAPLPTLRNLQTHPRILAARCARALPSNFLTLQHEGAGNAGRPMRPAVSCATGTKKRTRAYRSHRNHPTFPAQWVTAYNALTSANRAFCHRHPRETFASWEFDTSVGVSGPHVFTVRFRRARPSHRRRPPHPRLTFVTIAKRPPWRSGMVRNIDPLRMFCKSEYFYLRGLTGFWVFCPSGGFVEMVQEIFLKQITGWVATSAKPVASRSSRGLMVRDAQRCAPHHEGQRPHRPHGETGWEGYRADLPVSEKQNIFT